MTREEMDKILSLFFDRLENVIVSKYYDCLKDVQNITCNLEERLLAKLEKNVCHIDFTSLHGACVEMKNDILFLLKRRGQLIDELKPSFGKIAGVVAYRLAKNQIVHLSEECALCNKSCTVKKLSQTFALQCAWEYISVHYLSVPKDIRKELFYSFTYRHVNQETLGLVFDTISTVYRSNQ